MICVKFRRQNAAFTPGLSLKIVIFKPEILKNAYQLFSDILDVHREVIKTEKITFGSI